MSAPGDHTETAGEAEVAVIGLGYVGLALAVAFAQSGLTVLGVETNGATAVAVRAGRPMLSEEGLVEALAALPAGRLVVHESMPDQLPPAVVLCVGTPVDARTRQPDLTSLDSAVEAVAARTSPDTLIVVRSTVPVGTTERRVLPALSARVATPLLAYCAERTIQGRALTELRTLPQVIGPLNAESAAAARRLFGNLTDNLVTVSSIAAAELVKLLNNAHTDVIYGFGNEVALMAQGLGLDADEVIHAANVGYPRPDLSRPGFVGGSCLTKDPYLLLHSLAPTGFRPGLITAARALNESVPGHAVDRVIRAVKAAGQSLSDSKVLVCGMAYKGRPETDDVRGSAAAEVIRRLAGQVGTVAGHDFVVPAARVAALGYQPVSLEDGLRDANAMMVLVDHPGYSTLQPSTVAPAMRPPAVVFDMWGVLRPAFEGCKRVRYLRWGRG